MNDLFVSLAEVVCFDGTVDPPADPPANPPADPPAQPDAGKVFDQDEVNRIVEERLARSKKQYEEKYVDLEGKYSSLLENKNLTEDDRNKLTESLEDVRKQLRSKEAQANHERKQLQEEYEGKLSAEQKARQEWENRYYDSTITRSLQDAAIGADVYNAKQVVTLLRPLTKLVPAEDELGNHNGDFKTVVDFPDRDENGKEIMTQGTPDDIVKRMKELDDYANLFKANVVSGVGGTNATGGMTPGANGRIDPSTLTMEQYMKLRKERPEAFGLK